MLPSSLIRRLQREPQDGDELQVYDLGGPVSSLKIGRSCFYAILLNQIIACNIKVQRAKH